MELSPQECENLMKRLVFIDDIRNKLLTFSFTAVWAILAIFISMHSVSTWGCLIAYFLIIPFSARIAYYRMASAYISSFLKKFNQADMKFAYAAPYVPEDVGCKFYGMISWLVNHEMFFLGVAVNVIFYWKFFSQNGTIRFSETNTVLAIIVPNSLLLVTFLILDATFNYKAIMDRYTKKWDLYEKYL